MEVLNILIEHKIIFSILIGILIINFSFIFYFVLKERKEDKKEIDEILNELEPKEKIEKEEKQDKELENNKKEVEEMLLKMQKDLEAKPEDVVTNFENEQEEKSIISYQELVKSVKEKNNNINVQPVKIEEEKIEVEDVSDDTLELEQLKEKKFKGTEFISPIFGKQNNKIKYPTVPKVNNTLLDEIDFDTNYVKSEPKQEILSTKKLDKEIKKNDDFLNALKEFRKNLE